jgi:RNA polymerase sigma factor (sigma-70 family)
MTPESELLQRYAEHGDETAFAEIVHRYLSLVYGTALRTAQGNTALAQDATQTVFTDLAGKAAALSRHPTVAGWLHTSARFAAAKAIRAEQCRRAHEQEAAAMTNPTITMENTWAQVSPLIDEAVSQLNERDRNAVLLRFFADKSHREVGEALGLNENAARMRVERAMEKLRAYFSRHGVTTTAALLTSTLGAEAASVPVPEGWAATVTGKSLAGAAGLKAAGGQALLTKAHWFLMSGLAVVLAGAVVLLPNWQKEATTEKPNAAVTMSAASVLKPMADSKTAQPPLGVAVAAGGAAMATVPAATTQSAQAVSGQMNSSMGHAVNVKVNVTLGVTSTGSEQSADRVVDAAATGAVTGIATWGGNGHGELGAGFNGGPNLDGHAPCSSEPVLVDALGVLKGKTVVAIACGGSYLAHGLGPNGEDLGNSSISEQEGGGGAALHRLALCSDGTVVAWGCDETGELGDGKSGKGVFSNVPVLVDMNGAMKGKRIVKIAAGEGYSAAVSDDGKLYMWGKLFQFGGVFTGSHADSTIPVWVKEPALENRQVVEVAAGSGGLLALCSDGALLSLGTAASTWSYHAADGVDIHVAPMPPDFVHFRFDPLDMRMAGTDGDWNDGETPSPGLRAKQKTALWAQQINTSGLLAGKTIIGMATKGGKAVLTADGTVALWGWWHPMGKTLAEPTVTTINNVAMMSKTDGTEGENSDFNQETPVYFTQDGLQDGARTSRLGFTGVPGQFPQTYAPIVFENGSLARGIGAKLVSMIPMPLYAGGVLQNRKVTAVTVSGWTGLALCADGVLITWGTGDFGELGNGESRSPTATAHIYAAKPVLVKKAGVLDGKTVTAIAPASSAGFYAFCSDGTLVAWGDGSLGELGDGKIGGSNVPVKVDQTGVLKGKKIIAIAPGMALFEEPAK